MNIAVYAGSFDPFTFGHLSVALNAARLFEEVIILVAVSSEKDCMFTEQERVDLIRKVIGSEDNITVAKTKGYVVQYARHANASYMVRGIRNVTDAQSELMLAEFNTAFAPEIQTIFLPANQTLSKVSSSQLKEAFLQGRDVKMYCDHQVIRAMKEKNIISNDSENRNE
jgi:pantetheine-phosphate adenylyltransferase